MKLSMNLWRHPRHGTWYVWIGRCEKYPRGKLVSLKTSDQDEAYRVYTEVKRRHLEDKLIRLTGGDRLTISQLSEKFTQDEDRSGLSDATFRMDKLALKMLQDAIGDKPIRAITEADLKRFKTLLQAPPRSLSPYSINSYRRHILAALNWAAENEYVNRVPKFKPVPTGTRLPKFLTPEEIKAVLAKAKKEDSEIHRLAVFALWTGCRLSECLSAEWQRFDGEGLRVIGKGNRERIIPILAPAREVMGERKDIGRIFRQFHPNTVSHRFSLIATSVGCEKTFHGLRHSAATYMLKNRIPLNVVQKILGHAEIRTTQIYAQVIDEMVREEMQKLRF